MGFAFGEHRTVLPGVSWDENGDFKQKSFNGTHVGGVQRMPKYGDFVGIWNSILKVHILGWFHIINDPCSKQSLKETVVLFRAPTLWNKRTYPPPQRGKTVRSKQGELSSPWVGKPRKHGFPKFFSKWDLWDLMFVPWVWIFAFPVWKDGSGACFGGLAGHVVSMGTLVGWLTLVTFLEADLRRVHLNQPKKTPVSFIFGISDLRCSEVQRIQESIFINYIPIIKPCEADILVETSHESFRSPKVWSALCALAWLRLCTHADVGQFSRHWRATFVIFLGCLIGRLGWMMSNQRL